MAANFKAALSRRNKVRDELAAELESQSRKEAEKRNRRRLAVLVIGAFAAYHFHKKAIQPSYANYKQIQEAAKKAYAARKLIAETIAAETKAQLKNSGKTMMDSRAPAAQQASASPPKARRGQGQGAGSPGYSAGETPPELGKKPAGGKGKGPGGGKGKEDYASPPPSQFAEAGRKPKHGKGPYQPPGGGQATIQWPKPQVRHPLAQDKYEHVGSAVPRALSENTAQFPGVTGR